MIPSGLQITLENAPVELNDKLHVHEHAKRDIAQGETDAGVRSADRPTWSTRYACGRRILLHEANYGNKRRAAAYAHRITAHALPA